MPTENSRTTYPLRTGTRASAVKQRRAPDDSCKELHKVRARAGGPTSQTSRGCLNSHGLSCGRNCISTPRGNCRTAGADLEGSHPHSMLNLVHHTTSGTFKSSSPRSLRQRKSGLENVTPSSAVSTSFDADADHGWDHLPDNRVASGVGHIFGRTLTAWRPNWQELAAAEVQATPLCEWQGSSTSTDNGSALWRRSDASLCTKRTSAGTRSGCNPTSAGFLIERIQRQLTLKLATSVTDVMVRHGTSVAWFDAPTSRKEAWAGLVGRDMEVPKSHRIPMDLLQNSERATSMTKQWRHKVLTHYRGQQAFGPWTYNRPLACALDQRLVLGHLLHHRFEGLGVWCSPVIAPSTRNIPPSGRSDLQHASCGSTCGR